MRPRRYLSQVFLRSEKYIKKISDSLDINGEKVLEIGPGDGALTGYLSKKAKYLHCIELDSYFCNLLKQKFSVFPNVEILHQDILEFSFSKFTGRVIVVGNVPYQISTRLIRYLINNKKYIKRAYLTFQREFADKLLAKYGNKNYTFLSCFVQYHAAVKKLFSIPQAAFWPQPKVNSSFIAVEFYPTPPYKTKNSAFLLEIIRKSFSQPKKKLINSLKNNYPKDILAKVFSDLGIDSSLRPKDFSLKDYIDLANRLYGLA